MIPVLWGKDVLEYLSDTQSFVVPDDIQSGNHDLFDPPKRINHEPKAVPTRRRKKTLWRM